MFCLGGDLGHHVSPRLFIYSRVQGWQSPGRRESMTCNRPLRLYKYDVVVPCGRCMACRIARAGEWAVRLMHESYDWEQSVFVTLTYNEECLPKDLKVSKIELQNYIKRLRRRIEPKNIKYYACGEYGTKGRPHYHLIIYGIGIKDLEVIKKWNPAKKAFYLEVWKGSVKDAWQGKGNVIVGTVTYQSCRYVGEYIQKKLYYGATNQPFAIMSKGLGAGYVHRNSKQFEDNLSIRMNGKKVITPKYYIEILARINTPKGGTREEWKKRVKLKKEEYTKRLLYEAEEKRYKKGEKLYGELGNNELVYKDIVNNRNGSEIRLKKKQEIFKR